MSNTISSDAVVGAVARLAQALRDESTRLNDLDQAMGDGDIGITLDKIGVALLEYTSTAPVDDIGKWLGKAGMVANKAGSSSFGTLLASAFMRAGKAMAGKQELTPDDLAEIFSVAYVDVQNRGKANLGDKTVLDAMHPASVAFAAAIAGGADPHAAGLQALQAAEAGRNSVTPLRSKIGRASWVGERSEGKVDPGCEALVVMLRAVVG